MNTLTWLHLSDWHQQGPDFNRSVVRDALIADIRDRAKIDPGLSHVDLVIFSGDVAWSGAALEFESASRELFDPLLKALREEGFPRERVLFVPGNHDLALDHAREMLPPELQAPLVSEDRVQHWLTDAKRRSRAMEPFEAYGQFVAGYGKLDSPSSTYGGIWRDFVREKRVGILLLNSAWMCGRNRDSAGKIQDKGHLVVGEPQLHEVLKKLKGTDVRLAVLHHPSEWLSDFDRHRIEKRLKKECHFLLHGHEHNPGFTIEIGSKGSCVVIPAGASYDRRSPEHPRYANAYNFVRLDFATGRGEIFLRRWDDVNSRWREDHDSHDGGRLDFPLPKELSQPVTQPPLPPTTVHGGVPESAGLRQYRDRVLLETSELHLIGLGHGLELKLPIEQAFVPLNVAATRDIQRKTEGKFDPKSMESHDHCDPNVRLADVFHWAHRYGSRGVLLLGDPGAGKTTGARQFCWRALQSPAVRQELGLAADAFPVFLRLRHVNATHLTSGLRSFLGETLGGSLSLADGTQLTTELLARQGVLWVFDGLDEVVSETARIQVCHWIKEALSQRTHDFFFVTSRYQGYQGEVNLGADFCEFHVRPLETDQSSQFVHSWYQAVHGRLFGEADTVRTVAKQEATNLLELIQQPDYRVGRLRELPSNPLLLTILCLVHHQDHNLPRRRADLYGRCVRVLLEHWRQDARKAQGVPGFDADAAERVLAEVAWWLHGQEGRSAHGIEELGRVAAQVLTHLGPGSGLGLDGPAFIRRMRDESGILAMWNPGQCGFLHLTFQEYLAGQSAASEARARELAAHVGKSWWREVLLLSIAVGSKDFATTFFTALVESGSVESDPTLVDQSLQEARYALIEPFLHGIQQAAPNPDRQLALLRRLLPFVEQAADDLIAICRPLMRSPHAELASLAREVLQRAGVAVPTLEISVGPPPAKTVLHKDSQMVFVEIPAGEFDMGAERFGADERPVHRVRISRPFLMGKYPVTNEEYQRYLLANPSVHRPVYWNDSQWNAPRQPVVGVNWHDAMAYCQWAGFRLPTEAEWEFACRSGNPGRYCFGDDERELGDYAWYSGNSLNRTHEVGQKKPNVWGLHDMHGNVWEWCQDWYGKYSDKPVTDPQGPAKGTSRVLRGGSWVNGPIYLRSAYRGYGSPVGRDNDIGFRCVWRFSP